MASPVKFPKKEEDLELLKYNPDGTPIESSKAKFWRKMTEQPLVPIGELDNLYILFYVVLPWHLMCIDPSIYLCIAFWTFLRITTHMWSSYSCITSPSDRE